MRAQLALLSHDGPAELAAYLDAFVQNPDFPSVRAALGAIARERLAAGDSDAARQIEAQLRSTPKAPALGR